MNHLVLFKQLFL